MISTKQIAVSLMSVVLLLAAGVSYVYFKSRAQASPDSWPTAQFTPEVWRSAAKEERFLLYNDLAARKVLEGKTKSDVVTLLGKPDFEAPDGRYITYVVKAASPNEYTLNAIYLLHIDLDEKGDVKKYFIRAK